MEKFIKLGLLIVFILIISNTTIIKIFFYEGMLNSYNFRTKNNEFTFILISEKGRDLNMMNSQFELFKVENSQTLDTVLYRTFEKKPLKFWNWYAYYSEAKYQYPFLKE